MPNLFNYRECSAEISNTYAMFQMAWLHLAKGSSRLPMTKYYSPKLFCRHPLDVVLAPCREKGHPLPGGNCHMLLEVQSFFLPERICVWPCGCVNINLLSSLCSPHVHFPIRKENLTAMLSLRRQLTNSPLRSP